MCRQKAGLLITLTLDTCILLKWHLGPVFWLELCGQKILLNCRPQEYEGCLDNGAFIALLLALLFSVGAAYAAGALIQRIGQEAAPSAAYGAVALSCGVVVGLSLGLLVKPGRNSVHSHKNFPNVPQFRNLSHDPYIHAG